ncbi:hypothetical protein [Saccharolobus shibatae]|nr:hypothetical protein [Saccharolobus shibatae]
MVSHGKCMLCNKEITTSTALRHFKSCDNVKDILNGEIDGFIISIKDRYSYRLLALYSSPFIFYPRGFR